MTHFKRKFEFKKVKNTLNMINKQILLPEKRLTVFKYLKSEFKKLN